MYVIDSTDRRRMEETGTELLLILEEARLCTFSSFLHFFLSSFCFLFFFPTFLFLFTFSFSSFLSFCHFVPSFSFFLSFFTFPSLPLFYPSSLIICSSISMIGLLFVICPSFTSSFFLSLH